MNTFVWIGVIILAAAGLMAIASARRLPRLDTAQAMHLASHTLRQVKRIIILVVGLTVVVVGIVMLVAPGPGLVVIPVGLAVLATEFVWARRLLANYKRYALEFATRAERHEVSRPRPLLAVIVIAATLACMAAAYWLHEWPTRPILAIGGGAVGLETAWCVLMVSRYRKRSLRAAAEPTPSDVPSKPVE